MRLATFSIPDGWTYTDYRSFLQAELSEDKPGGTEYPWLIDFDDSMLVFEDDYGSTLYQIGYSIAQGDGGKDVVWDGDPVEVTERTVYEKVAEMATFSLDGAGTVEGDFVLRSGKVFEIGEYPDKNFSLTAAEAEAAIAAFQPVENRVQHLDKSRHPTIFDGKMGDLRSVEFAEDGKSIIGTIAIPKWLDDFNSQYTPNAPFKASLEWTYDSKQIFGNTLIPNPRIADSALFGAYAAFTGGAVDAPVASTKERVMAEAVKDKVAEAPKATFSDADVAAMQAKIDALQAQATAGDAVIAKMKGETIAANAAAFAKEQIAASKAVPAQEAALVAAFSQAALDDDASPRVVTFAEGDAGKGTRVDALRAVWKDATPHILARHMADGEAELAGFASAPKDANLQKVYEDTKAAAEKMNPAKK